MNGNKIMAMAVVGIFILSSLSIIPSSVKAYPSLTPQTWEILFYDDFEVNTFDNITWTIPTGETLYAPILDDTHVFHGLKAAHFDVWTQSKCIRRSLGANNTNVMIELEYWENATDTSQASYLKVSNATTAIQFGIRTTEAATKYDLRLNSVGSYPVNFPREAGWTNLKLLLVNGLARAFINNDYMGERPLVNALTYEFRSDTATSDSWIDQFTVYRFYQDTIWKRPASTTAVITYNNSWSKQTIAEPSILYEGGVYKMWYRGVNYSAIPKYGQTTALGYATSPDGLTWTQYAGNPISPLGWCPNVRKIGSTYYLYDSSTYPEPPAPDKWRYAFRTSTDGITWSPSVINTDLTIGTGTWDNLYFGNNDFWFENGVWYMLYEAAGTTSSWKIGLATSSNGINWTKYPGNPIIGTSSITAGGPNILKIGETYYCWYHKGGTYTEIALVESTDLHIWRESSFHIQLPREAGRIKENMQTADPFVISNAAGTGSLLYFCGTSNATNGELFVATSAYTLAQIVGSQIYQWGKQIIGDIDVTNNVTATGINWYSGINAIKGTYFRDLNLTTTSDVNVTMLSRSPGAMSWSADSGGGIPIISSTLSNSENMHWKVLLDGQFLTVGDGMSFSFNYAGPWTIHQFDVIYISMSSNVSGLLYLIPFFLTLGILMVPVNMIIKVTKQKRMLRVGEVVRMVVTIVVGLALVGITYLMI